MNKINNKLNKIESGINKVNSKVSKSKKEKRVQNVKNSNVNKVVNKLIKKIDKMSLTGTMAIRRNHLKFNNKAVAKNVYTNSVQRTIMYIADILDPEISVTSGAQVKQPNLFQIPSASVGLRNTYDITVGGAGEFYLAWNPNYLVNKQYLESVKYTINNGGVATTGSPNGFFNLVVKVANGLKYFPTYVPDINFVKYRLVSAKIKVSYIGSMLNKSGMFYACASFDQSPVGISHFVNEDMVNIKGNDNSTSVDFNGANMRDDLPQTDVFSKAGPCYVTYHNLTKDRISNGLWNRSVNIVETSQGISCTHIPCDPTSNIFYPTGEYFGFDYKDFDKLMPLSYDNTYSRQLVPTICSDVGSQLCYYIMGVGLPPNQKCVNIQCYYNFEIIPTLTTAPFLRSSTLSDEFNRNQINAISDSISRNAKGVAIRVGKSQDITSRIMRIASGVGGFANKLLKVLNAFSSAL